MLVHRRGILSLWITKAVLLQPTQIFLFILFPHMPPNLPSPARRPILRSQDCNATDLEMKLGSERGVQLMQLCGPYMLRR